MNSSAAHTALLLNLLSSEIRVAEANPLVEDAG